MKIINFLAADGVELNGILYNSKRETKKIILSVHGMTSHCFKKRDEIIVKYVHAEELDF